MSNKKIAITWAQKQIKITTGFVYSDMFFKPFTEVKTRHKIIDELLAKNVVVWSVYEDGAFLFRKNDPRLLIQNNNFCKVGTWIDGDNIMILPQLSLH